jgi:hypothetical protein
VEQPCSAGSLYLKLPSDRRQCGTQLSIKVDGPSGAVCHAPPMHVSDEQRESLWSELVNKDGTRAPSDVVLAFASLGGSDPLTESISPPQSPPLTSVSSIPTADT